MIFPIPQARIKENTSNFIQFNSFDFRITYTVNEIKKITGIIINSHKLIESERSFPKLKNAPVFSAYFNTKVLLKYEITRPSIKCSLAKFFVTWSQPTNDETVMQNRNIFNLIFIDCKDDRFLASLKKYFLFILNQIQNRYLSQFSLENLVNNDLTHYHLKATTKK